ncbi:glycerol kinase GlpK [Laribacter hongkongensis]|uniref:glycerol kinase GlpK n=1 Tax=Laribacter hongkongensis TaxID=168471 RepID=UPI001EFD4317|nr:glycerol kinase GlpK [Laribacter hongkongensis]MCG9032294.1 glycerol kinase GlpK [Laribacter hongkongensis]MCG9092255.1 glycerol kinase GlpK [Laribacter hongkongensis]
MSGFLLAIDQGTTSSRAMVFDRHSRVVARASRELEQFFPAPGWVEHDPDALWRDVEAVTREALAALPDGAAIAAIGLTNQRETTLLWNRRTGRPLHRAIVWQDRRTAPLCEQLAGQAAMVQARTGLLLDPYFSATKLRWLLDTLPGAQEAACRGELAFGTVDSWLLWQLTEGRVHATDATNAARTLLFNIHTQTWDDELLALFDIPRSLLPEVRDSAADFGETRLFGAPLPIRGVAGDQQAAMIGQACFAPGMVKSTYGTGCFMVMNTGSVPLVSRHRLLTTVAYRLDGRPTYALEGSIFIAGAAVQWLRDALRLIAHAGQTEALARELDSNDGVYLVPAFTGLGAPYWDPLARGTITGLSRDTGINHIVRAALESVCYQSRDLLDAMRADGVAPASLRVDGGMAANDWLMQFLADMLALPVERPALTETTALGAAWLAGLGCGWYAGLDELAVQWHRQADFAPQMAADRRDGLYAGWRAAVERTLSGGVSG